MAVLYNMAVIQNPGYRTTKRIEMPQDDYNPINYTTGQPNTTPFVPGSEYKTGVSRADDKSESLFPSERDEAYMQKRARENVKRLTPKPPKEAYSYSAAYEARKKK